MGLWHIWVALYYFYWKQDGTPGPSGFSKQPWTTFRGEVPRKFWEPNPKCEVVTGAQTMSREVWVKNPKIDRDLAEFSKRGSEKKSSSQQYAKPNYHLGRNYYKIIPLNSYVCNILWYFSNFSSWMQSVFVIITKLIASKNYLCKEFFVIILATMVRNIKTQFMYNFKLGSCQLGSHFTS